MLDKALRNTLRIMVTEARKILDGAARTQLQGQFGIHGNGTIEPATAMQHLSEEDRHYREQIIAHLTHMHVSGFTVKDAIAQLVREVAFTHLNRLCAYKIMESRALIREAVSRGFKSKGFLFYLADHPEEEQLWSSGKQSVAYRHFLTWHNEKLSTEIGVLFSPGDPANRLFPPQNKLDEVLALINSEELRDIWSEDEIIGWVYQYFTPKELRDQARNESQAPRNSYELAFRNQFYTPRYVVHFLTDNTLGRTWYEMRQGQTQLKGLCSYMVRRPDEVFFAEPPSEEIEQAQQWLQGENIPEPSLVALAHTINGYVRWEAFNTETSQWLEERLTEVMIPPQVTSLKTQELLDILFLSHRMDRFSEGFLDSISAELEVITIEIRKRVAAQHDENRSQEELLRAPFFIAFRSPKNPQEIKILDPACGSGHFLLYCFDLLITIYLEAYEAAEPGSALKQDYPTVEDLQRAIPGLILANNVHGIDIDLRATQIASLALWLRAQRAYQEFHIVSDRRPPIRKSNIVCAEPMPGEKDMLEEFTNTLQPQILGKLVQTAFEKMKLASEAGSLLKIEEEIKDAVREAKKLWLSRPQAEQLTLWAEPEAAVIQQASLDLEIPDIAFWNGTEQRIIEALQMYATSVANGRGFARQLFADDAVQGFAFIDLCQKRFDIVLTNPPFGEASKPSKTYIEHTYINTKNDIYAAFIERWIDKLVSHGMLGAITSRTGFFLTSFKKWREEILLEQTKPTVFADLGQGVLDTAMVEAAAYCLEKKKVSETVFLRLLPYEDKPTVMIDAIKNVNEGYSLNFNSYIVNSDSFSLIPGSPFAYWVNRYIRNIFSSTPRLVSEERDAQSGVSTMNDFRFLRIWWEIEAALAARNRESTLQTGRWVPLAKGGAYSPFYTDWELVIDWMRDGEILKQEVSNYRGSRGWGYQWTAAINGHSSYFRPGLTWPRRTSSGISVRVLPQGCIFADKGPAVFSSYKELPLLLAVMNSQVFEALVATQLGAADAAARSYEVGLIENTPVPNLSVLQDARLGELALNCVHLKRNLDTINETSHVFNVPALLQIQGHSLHDRYTAWQTLKMNTNNQLEEYQREINDIVFRLYKIDNVNRQTIEKPLNNKGRISLAKHSSIDEDDEVLSQTTSDIHHVTADLCSYTLGCSFGRWDIRFAIDESLHPDLPDPFAPLLICSPGMLTGGDKLPLGKNPFQYPLTINWDGILVDDPDHYEDIISRVQHALLVIWREQAEAIEQEACQILGIKDLREYFRRASKGGFWTDHIQKYSKSRRKAPIYWLLQSSKKNYAVWLYYHHLTKDTLFKVLSSYVEPKLRREVAQLEQLRIQLKASGLVGREAKKLERLVERQENLLSELEDFRDKLRSAADLNLEPDLNDGVVLNIAPLRELVPWGEAKKYWEELLAGKYEWSSISQQLRAKGLV